VQEAGLQEGFILTGPYHSSHIVRGPQDSLQIYPRSDFIHRYLSWTTPKTFLLVLRMRIRIDLALLDLDLYRKCGSGSRSKIICQNLQINLISSRSKRLLYLRKYVMIYTTSYKKYIVKIQLTMAAKPDQVKDLR
jgi:hypothetical protein